MPQLNPLHSAPVKRVRHWVWERGLFDLTDKACALMERGDPSLVAARRSLSPPPQIALVGVYRSANAAEMLALVRSLPSRSSIALWALDESHPDLAPWTVGTGLGMRFTLLNRCVEHLTLASNAWLVATDDDVEFERGSIVAAVRIARAAGLDLAQPAHTWQSNLSWRYNRRQLLTVARRGGFVEIGPIVLIGPEARKRGVVPFPELDDMGWGVEADWGALQRGGLRLGVVDAVRIVHLAPMGESYVQDPERERGEQRARDRGFSGLAEMQVDYECWRPWSAAVGRSPSKS